MTVLLLFAQRAAQDIGPAGRQPGEGFADLQDVFLVNDQTERALEARFQ